ncbi:MAG: pyridoxal phosphate-dependent aminotransferase [candidate division KSB1 bacterium]|nr:pyridoxal phosphate-dependent aminotransferase [candidate division KSB1 bacterium]
MIPSQTGRFSFSGRLKWNLQTNRLSLLLEEKRRQAAPILDLTESNPTAAGIDYPGDEILQALAQPSVLRYEPNAQGLPAARQAVAEYYRQRGAAVEPARIHLTVSTSEAYAYLFKLLTDPGQNVLVPQPSYPLFEFLAGFEGLELVPYHLVYDNKKENWRIDVDSVKAAINRRTRAIIVVNPNNPTGSFIKRDELTTLIDLCATQQLALIVDEVFSDYVLASDPASVGTLVSVAEVPTFVLNGLSKMLGLPQMKLGWMVVNGPEPIRRQAQEYLDLIADTYLSVSTPIQHAAPVWLSLRPILQGQIRDRIKKNFEFLQTQMGGHSYCRLCRAEGGWYAVMALPFLQHEEEFVLQLLERDEVLVHPGYFFDFAHAGFLVLSLLPALASFREGVTRLLTRIQKKFHME